MGLFGGLKKEGYINKLALSFRAVYGCGDYAAFVCLRKNYTLDELKNIFDDLTREEEQGTIHFRLLNNPPFKDDPEKVFEVDMKWGGK